MRTLNGLKKNPSKTTRSVSNILEKYSQRDYSVSLIISNENYSKKTTRSISNILKNIQKETSLHFSSSETLTI